MAAVLAIAALQATGSCGQDHKSSPSANCDSATVDRVRRLATEADPEVVLNCSITMAPHDVITKRIIVEGSGGSGVTIDCNGATIDGSRVSALCGTEGNKRNMVLIASKGAGDLAGGAWTRPTDVTVKNCNVIGGVRIQSIRSEGLLRNSSYQANHTVVMQRVAPKRITLDNLTVTAREWIPVYFESGVSESKLINSELKGQSNATAVYLDAESTHNLIKHNDIHTVTGREVMAIDGSSGNRVIDNHFSALSHGGIYLYRNCGQSGIVRHTTPAANEIVNNVFYYDKYNPSPPWAGSPSVFLGSRNGSPGYCGDDKGHPFGSSVSNLDYAQNNVVMQNQIYKLEPRWMIREGRSTDKPNYIDGNTRVTTAASRPAGCFLGPLGSNVKSFILDGEKANGLTCVDGDLTP